MGMTGRLVAVAFALLPLAVANCQSLSGRVTCGEDRKPVAGAYAVALSLPDSTVAAFAVTNAEGMFEINKELSAPCCLRVSCLGFATRVVTLKALSPEPMAIELADKAFSLKEVSVSRRAPGAAVRGDTVRFNLPKYVDGTELVLGDVLGKLPGISVTESGKVTSGGKLVDNILLNGQDFTGDRHEVLTKNLPGEMVEKVELIKNYNEYSVLDGFKSKGTAINIGVDSAYTRRPTGNVELWGGYKEKYRARANLFFIGSDAMWCVNARACNTGEETMSDEQYLELCGGVKSFADAISGCTAVVARPVPSVDSYLKANMSTRRREDQVVTANAAWNPSERLRVKAYAIFNREATGAAEDVRRAFIGKEARSPISLSQRSDDDRKITSGRVEAKYETRSDGVVSYLGKLSGSPDKYAQYANFCGDTKWGADSRRFHTSHDISFAQRITRDQMLTLRAYGEFDRDKTCVSLSADTALAVGYASGVWQKAQTLTRMSGGSASYIVRLRGKVRLRASVAYDFDRGAYRAESQEADLSTPSSRSDCGSTTISLSAHKIKGKLRADAGLHLARVSSDASRMRWKLLPEATLTFNFSKLHSLEVNYEASLSRDGMIPWTAAKRLTGYRTISDFAARPEMLHLCHGADVFYMFYDRFADLSVTLFGGLNVETSPCAYDISTRGDALVENRASSSRDDRSAFCQLAVDKGFAFPLRAKVEVQSDCSLTPVFYSGDICTSRAYEITSALSLRTRFRRPVNVEAGGTYGYARTEIDVMGGPSEWRSFSLRLQPMAASKRIGLKAKLPVTYISDRSNGQRVGYVDLSFEADKKVGAHLSFFAEARDLLHSDRQRRVVTTVDGDTEDTATESRMPGFVIAGFKWLL